MCFGTAIRVFFAALFNRDVADCLRRALDAPSQSDESIKRIEATKPTPPASPRPNEPGYSRSDAITLLATLQREARLVDLIQEDLTAYSDAQIGAAARPCLKQCAATLQRVLALRPLEPTPDGTVISVPKDASILRYQWIGEAEGDTGKLLHHGWQATHVQLSEWTGGQADQLVIAPAQVQRVTK